MFSTRYGVGNRHPEGMIVFVRRCAWAIFCCALLLACAVRLNSQAPSVHGSVRVLHHDESAAESGDVVVWLTPLQSTPLPVGPGPAGDFCKRERSSFRTCSPSRRARKSSFRIRICSFTTRSRFTRERRSILDSTRAERCGK